MNNILEITELRKTFKGFTLEDISFRLERGYIMGFIGPNGAGKSTTIRLIMNLINRDGGDIKIFGLDNIKFEREVKQRIGFVYDENYYYEELTLLEIKRFIAPFYRQWDDRAFMQYLHRFDLAPKKRVKELSKGMKMKFSLALALSHHPELIIMDEPTSGLDPVFRNEVLEILADIIQDETRGILFSTHITSDLDKIADYVTFINQGRIVFSEAKDSLLDSYALVKGGRELLDRDTRKEFVGIRENQFGFEALTRNATRTRSIFGDRVLVERATLEDIMLYTVRGNTSA